MQTILNENQHSVRERESECNQTMAKWRYARRAVCMLAWHYLYIVGSFENLNTCRLPAFPLELCRFELCGACHGNGEYLLQFSLLGTATKIHRRSPDIRKWAEAVGYILHMYSCNCELNRNAYTANWNADELNLVRISTECHNEWIEAHVESNYSSSSTLCRALNISNSGWFVLIRHGILVFVNQQLLSTLNIL